LAKTTGVWDERLDEIGLTQLRLERRGLGVLDDVFAVPALEFDSDEIDACLGMALLPMVYGWDAYIIPDTADLLVYISHDEYMHLGARSRHLLHTLLEPCRRFSPQWRPDPGDGLEVDSLLTKLRGESSLLAPTATLRGDGYTGVVHNAPIRSWSEPDGRKGACMTFSSIFKAIRPRPESATAWIDALARA
jgi:hypothetical protein